MADPKTTKQRIDDRIHMLSSSSDGERRMAFAAAERLMQSEGFTWRDVHIADGKYTEAEMQELAQAARAEGVEDGIKIGMARARNGNGSDGLTLPAPLEMARYCHERPQRLKDDNQRDFIDDVYVIAQRGRGLSPGRLGYLASIYIQLGGKV
jgi:hypothetical protein